MRISQIISLMVVFWMGTVVMAWSQEDIPASFDYTLDTLRQSVARLTNENAALESRNVKVRAQVKSLEESLRSLENESSRLNDKKSAMLLNERRHPDSVAAMKESLGRSVSELSDLEKELEDQNYRLKDFEAQAKALQETIDASKKSKENVDPNEEVSAPFKTQMMLARTKRDEAKKDFFTLANKLQAAKKRWEEVSQLASVKPKNLDAIKADEAALKAMVASLESDIAALKASQAQVKESTEAMMTDDYSDIRLTRLENEVKDISEDSRKLEGDVMVMQKAQDEKLKDMQQVRDAKLKGFQSKMDALSKRNQDLRKELESLRLQMVSLDKKKSRLEAGLYTDR